MTCGGYRLNPCKQLDLTILYEHGDDDWIVSSIPAVPAVSHGRTREEAREVVGVSP